MFEISVDKKPHNWILISKKPLKNKLGHYNILQCDICKIKAKSYITKPDILNIVGTYSVNKVMFCNLKKQNFKNTSD